LMASLVGLGWVNLLYRVRILGHDPDYGK